MRLDCAHVIREGTNGIHPVTGCPDRTNPVTGCIEPPHLLALFCKPRIPSHTPWILYFAKSAFKTLACTGVQYGSVASLQVLHTSTCPRIRLSIDKKFDSHLDSSPADEMAKLFFVLSEKAREYNHPEAISWLATWNASKRSIRHLFTRESVANFFLSKRTLTFTLSIIIGIQQGIKMLTGQSLLDSKRNPLHDRLCYPLARDFILWNVCTAVYCATLPLLNRVFPALVNRTNLNRKKSILSSLLIGLVFWAPESPTWLRLISGILATIDVAASHRRHVFE